MEFEIVRSKIITDIDEYERSDEMYCPEGSNVYEPRKFLPNLTFYRYHDAYYMGDRITLWKFKAIRETPCGYWILDYSRERWVSKDSMRRFAYPTKEEAWVNFVARKNRQLKLLKARMRDVEHTLDIIKKIEDIKKPLAIKY